MTLAAQITLHRNLYRDELRRPFQMTVAQVPDETEPIQIGDAMVDVTDSGPLGGPAFSRPMNRHLGPVAGYGVQRPWSYSLAALRHACRKDHPGHTERRTFGGSLCWQAVSYAICSRYEVDTVAHVLSDPPDFLIEVADAERHLRRSLGWIEEHMDRGQMIRNARDPQPSEEPTPTRISLLQCDAVTRAVVNFDLEQRIWEGQVGIMRRKLGDKTEVVEFVRDPTPHYVTMTIQEWETKWSWENEWARRQQALSDHEQTCDRCRRAA